MRIPAIALLLALAVLAPQCQALADADRLAPLQFLVGDWIGEGSGKPGDSTATFSFTPELQYAALIRRAHSDYPATPERAAFAHDDLLIVYPVGDAQFEAFYYDNEGHAIRYRATLTKDGVTFLSEPTAGQPRFKLSYARAGEGRLHILFAIAPPGSPDTFQTYVEGDAHKK